MNIADERDENETDENDAMGFIYLFIKSTYTTVLTFFVQLRYRDIQECEMFFGIHLHLNAERNSNFRFWQEIRSRDKNPTRESINRKYICVMQYAQSGDIQKK